jgi:hypothetical protein
MKNMSSFIVHLGLNSDKVTSLQEIEVFGEDSCSTTARLTSSLPTENAGRVGLVRVIVSLASM